MNLKTKTVCIVDNGLFVSFARLIGRDFGRAYYYVPWQSKAPRTNDIEVGRGFDEIERIDNVFEKFDEIDLWVFLDLFQGELQCFLASHGARVWGTRHGEEMELNRWAFKKHLKKIGLPVGECWKVVGVEELRSLLKERENLYVKTDRRGDFETWRHDTWLTSAAKVNELEHVLGAVSGRYEFVVEEEIGNAVEVGYDGFTIDGQWPDKAMLAYEIKDCGMVGTVKEYKDLAQPVKTVNDKLSETLRGYQYRGFLSTEVRYTKNKTPYFIDPCCRLGTPSNELLQVLFDDWGNVIWNGAEGSIVPAKKKKTFGCLAMLTSEWAVDNWFAVHIPKELEEWVMLRMVTKVEEKQWVVPQIVGLPDVGCVVGVGDTLNGAIEDCKTKAKEIKGFGLKVELESLDKAVEVIEKGEKVGIKF